MRHYDKQTGILFLLFFLSTLPSVAEELSLKEKSLGFSYGQSKDSIDIYRLTLRKDFSTQWWESSVGYIGGYWEGSLNYWNGRGETNLGLAYSPVFTYTFQTVNSVTPYLEAGIGLSFFVNTEMGERNLSTHFLFEDRFGVGIKTEKWDASFRYMHYSNASMQAPNDGIDIFIGSLHWRF